MYKPVYVVSSFNSLVDFASYQPGTAPAGVLGFQFLGGFCVQAWVRRCFVVLLLSIPWWILLPRIRAMHVKNSRRFQFLGGFCVIARTTRVSAIISLSIPWWILQPCMLHTGSFTLTDFQFLGGFCIFSNGNGQCEITIFQFLGGFCRTGSRPRTVKSLGTFNSLVDFAKHPRLDNPR